MFSSGSLDQWYHLHLQNAGVGGLQGDLLNVKAIRNEVGSLAYNNDFVEIMELNNMIVTILCYFMSFILCNDGFVETLSFFI